MDTARKIPDGSSCFTNTGASLGLDTTVTALLAIPVPLGDAASLTVDEPAGPLGEPQA